MFGAEAMGIDFNTTQWEKLREMEDEKNVDWKQMYLHLFNAVTDAIEILSKAQGKCEEMYADRE